MFITLFVVDEQPPGLFHWLLCGGVWVNEWLLELQCARQ